MSSPIGIRREYWSIFAILAIMVYCLLAAPESQADTISDNVLFEVEDHSMWGSGDAAKWDKWSDPYYWSKDWSRNGHIVDGLVDLGILGYWGVDVYGATSGEVGFELKILADAGSLNASYPATFDLVLPDSLSPGQTFSVTSAINLEPGSLTTCFPTFQIEGNVTLEAHASLYGEYGAYYIEDFHTGDFVGLDTELELFSFNAESNNALELFGIQVPYTIGKEINITYPPNTPVGAYGVHIGEIEINLPNINTIGVPDADMVVATGSADVLYLGADVLNAAIVIAAEGLPIGLSYKLCPAGGGACISVTALQLNIGPVFGIQQEFKMHNPEPSDFLVSLLVEETGQEVSFRIGESADLLFPEGLSEIHITPTYLLEGIDIDNNTSIYGALNVNIEALGVSVLGIGGTLIDEDWQTPVLPIPIHFGLDLPDIEIQGEQFTYTAYNGATAPIPEPASMFLVGMGLLGLAGMRRLTSKGRKKL
ncbi:MAG: PEP-CTERM sorting domain-containing protein [Acidobacteria bacterium]|nr:PEP-CTERM sorting domain-containing protein [Acidobacteriota bacterium]